MEVIRQKTGKHLEAEFEYIFGDEAKFENICREALGETFIDILHYQSEKEFYGDKLAMHYNYNSNVNLGNLILGSGFDLDFEEQRYDGSYNVFNSGNALLKTLYFTLVLEKRAEQEGIDLYDVTPEQIPILLKIFKEEIFSDYELDTHMQETVKKRIIESLIKNNISFEDFIELKNNLGDFFEDFWNVLLLQQIDKVQIHELENYSEKDLSFIVQAIMNASEEKTIFLPIINKIDNIYKKRGDEKIFPLAKLILNISKAKLDSDNFPEHLKNIFKEENIIYLNVCTKVIQEGFNRFLDKTAFNNPETLKKTVSTLKNAEYQHADNSDLLDKLIKPLNIEYFKWLKNDVIEVMEIDLKIDINRIKKYDLQLLDRIVSYMMEHTIVEQNIPQEYYLMIVKKIDEIYKESNDISPKENLQLNIAKATFDKDNIDEHLSNVFELLSTNNEISESSYFETVNIYGKQISKAFETFLYRNAKEEPEKLRKLLSSFKNFKERFQKSQNTEQFLAISSMMDEIQMSYFNLVSNDIDLLESYGSFSCTTLLKQCIENKSYDEIMDLSIEDEVKMMYVTDSLNLSHENRKTELVRIFNQKNLREILHRKDLLSQIFSYKLLNSKKEKEMLFTEMIGYMEKSEDLTDMSKLIEFLDFLNFEDLENKQLAIEKLEKLLEYRNNPVEDLMTVYRKCKNEIPENMMFIYNQEMSNFEKMINEGHIDQISEESILLLMKIQPENKDLQVLLEETLKQKYLKKGLTTEKFIEEKTSLSDISSLAKAYLASIGKENDSIQLQSLIELKKRFMKGTSIPLPQYIPINNGSFVIVSNIEGNFRALGHNKDYIASAALLDAQNKKKRGIFSLLKKKEEKELITDTIVLDSLEGKTNVLNRYENGRLEIAQLDTSSDKKIKIIEKKEVVPIDIGNNGALTVTNGLVKKAFVKYQLKVTKDRTQNGVDERRATNGDNSFEEGVKS